MRDIETRQRAPRRTGFILGAAALVVALVLIGSTILFPGKPHLTRHQAYLALQGRSFAGMKLPKDPFPVDVDHLPVSDELGKDPRCTEFVAANDRSLVSVRIVAADGQVIRLQAFPDDAIARTWFTGIEECWLSLGTDTRNHGSGDGVDWVILVAGTNEAGRELEIWVGVYGNTTLYVQTVAGDKAIWGPGITKAYARDVRANNLRNR